ncbi:MAG: cation transporter [Clostridia bacterium]|nr:cation transporter [Clostridia bacterium]
MNREKKIIKVSLQGILMNLFLVIFKAIVGVVANSISIILDAVNNFSDMISAIITIIGAKLSNKAPDKDHPYGHGRIEYFSAIIISIIVMGAGVTALKESFSKIVSPVHANYSTATLIVVIVAIFVKFFFSGYVKKVGREINSQSLVATGADAFMDAILSFSTLVGAIISLAWNISIEGYLGVVISIIILKSAIEILKDTINTMLGERPDSELTKKIKDKINSYEGVYGANDLMLHSYGPDRLVGSVHITVKDSMTACDIHGLTRMIAEDIFDEYGIVLTIGIYALNDSGEAGEIKAGLEEILKDYKEIINLHGFYVNEKIKRVSFDLIFDFKCKNQEEIKKEIKEKLKEKFPDYRSHVLIDTDVSD